MTYDEKMHGAPEMLTARDLEAQLKINVKTVYGLVQRGQIPYVRIGSSVRFITQQIADWIEERNFKPHQSRGSRNRNVK